MDGRIRLTVPNLVIIGSVSLLSGIAAGAAMHFLSHKDVPAISPAARGMVDFINKVAA